MTTRTEHEPGAAAAADTSAALAERVRREREIYNEGLRRDRYQRVLGHTDHLPARRRDELAGRILREHGVGAALELGCKIWRPFLDRQGLRPRELHCVNISEAELEEGRALVAAASLQPTFHLMDAHALDFPDGHFDAVFGTGILHHLDLGRALAEIRRVLKPDGIMVFGEPLDNNPVGRVVRWLTPKARTADETPLRHADLARIRQDFDCELHFEQMLSVPAGLVSRLVFRDPDNPLTRSALAADGFLRARLPALGPYFRYALIVGRPRPAPAGAGAP